MTTVTIPETKETMRQTKEAGKFIPHTSSLQAGDKAPWFEGVDALGHVIRLSDFRDKKVLLYFYPKDNTAACTAQACNLRDHQEELSERGISVIGVSADSEDSHRRFAEKHELPFPLISDKQLEIIKAYDVWGQKMLYGRIYEGLVRTSFLIDERGYILAVLRDINTKAHSEQILHYFK